MTNQHVTRNGKGGWKVQGAGNSRATKNFDTQSKAIDFAKERETNIPKFRMVKLNVTKTPLQDKKLQLNSQTRLQRCFLFILLHSH